MSEKMTLYFVITKVIAPKNSFFNLILSFDNSQITLKSPRSRSNAYTIPYKIMKEVSIIHDEDLFYNIEIIFLDQDHPIATGSVSINPKEFLNANSIELKQYDLNVPNVDNVSVYVGVALIPIGKPFLPDFDIYGSSAKIISKNDSAESQSNSEISIANNPTEHEAEIVESESGKKHRRKRGTTDNECITFISQSGRSHKKHRIYSIPEHSPSFDQRVNDEEIIRSESGRPHRRKRGTKDAKTVTFISEGGHEHRRRRNHQSQQNEIQNQPNEIQDQDHPNDIENQSQQNEDQTQNQHRHHRHRSHNQQQQEEPETAIAESDNGKIHHRKRSLEIDSKTPSETSVSEGVGHHRKKKKSESLPNPQNDHQQEQQEQEPRRRRRRKPESEEKNEEKQQEEIITNPVNGSRRRRRKEKPEIAENEAEATSTSKENPSSSTNNS